MRDCFLALVASLADRVTLPCDECGRRYIVEPLPVVHRCLKCVQKSAHRP